MSRNPFHEGQLELFWQRESSDVLLQHRLSIIPISTGRSYESTECLRMRAFCHLLLDYLSEEGLEEIKDSLLEAVTFYREPQPVSEPFHLSDSFEVAVGEGYERPVFQIAED